MNKRAPLTSEQRDTLVELLEANPTGTLRDIAVAFRNATGRTISPPAVLYHRQRIPEHPASIPLRIKKHGFEFMKALRELKKLSDLNTKDQCGLYNNIVATEAQVRRLYQAKSV